MKNEAESTSPSLRSLNGPALTGTLLALGQLAVSAAPTPSVEEPAEKPKKSEDLAPLVVDAQGNKILYKPERLSSPKVVQPLKDVAQTVTVIPKEVITEQGAASLRDVLRNVPGISMQAGEGGGGPAGDNLSIRGFAARSDIFVDGIRDTSSGGYSRDPFNMEQVEVTKGPASANSGRGSTGGSVNIVTKTPHLGNSYGLMLGGGTDEYFRSTFDVNQEIPGLQGAAVRLNGVFHEQTIPGRDWVENDRWGFAPSIAFGLGTDTRVTLSYMYLDQDNTPDYGIPWVPRTSTNPNLPPGIPDVDFSNYYGALNRDYEKIRTNLVTGTIEHDFNDSLHLRATARYGRNDRDSVTTAPRFVNVNTSTQLNRQFQSRDQIDENVAAQVDLRYDFETGAIKHKMVGGFEVGNEESKNYARVSSLGNNPLTDIFNPHPHDPFSGTVSRTGAWIGTESDTLAFYLFDTIEFNKQWELSGGVRWDSFDVDYTSKPVTGAKTRLDRDDSMWSYRAALTYKPTRDGSIYLGYGTSFNPSTEGLTYIAAPTGTNATLSLFDADPEKNETVELGTKWEFFDQRLLTTAAIFYSEKTNARTTDPADPTVVELTGKQRIQGFEFGFTGSITDSWRIIGGYTYLDGEVRDSAVAAEQGSDLSNTPKNSFSLWTVHDLPAGFQVGLGTQFVDSRYNNNNKDTRQTAPSYTLIDAMVGYKVNENVSFRLNGYNLADKEYIDRVGGGHFVPGQGRSVTLTADLKF